MAKVEDVAAAILERFDRLDTIKLQKLVYYAQAWSATWRGRPLFADPVEAWDNGPVVYRLFKMHQGRYQVSNLAEGDASSLPADATPIIDFVCGFYGGMPSADLVLHVHEEDPWSDAWSQGRNTTIGVEAMVRYYGSLEEPNDQRWYWSKDWYDGQRAAEADAEAGRVERSYGDDDFLAALG